MSNSGTSESVAQLPSEMQYHNLAPSDPAAESRRTSQDNGGTSRTPSLAGLDASEYRRRSRPDEPFEQWERDEMEASLNQICGHLGTDVALDCCLYFVLTGTLVVYPTRFLEGEDVVNNFLFPSDRFGSFSVCWNFFANLPMIGFSLCQFMSSFTLRIFLLTQNIYRVNFNLDFNKQSMV